MNTEHESTDFCLWMWTDKVCTLASKAFLPVLFLALAGLALFLNFGD